jgi:uncharacterized protein YehS (DUF1456 family)
MPAAKPAGTCIQRQDHQEQSNLMNNNDILRRIRYIFDFNDKTMIATFAEAGHKATREQISDWLKKEEDPAYQECPDVELATFLNGLINSKRGKRDGPQPEPETRLTNNIIFMKLKIALNLQADDILEMLRLAEFKLSKHELSAFFRKADHKHYRKCQDQVLRHFLKGLQAEYRGTMAAAEELAHTPEAEPAAAPKAAAGDDSKANNSVYGGKSAARKTDKAPRRAAADKEAIAEQATSVAKAVKPAKAAKPKAEPKVEPTEEPVDETKEEVKPKPRAKPKAKAPRAETPAPAKEEQPAAEVESVWRRKKP